MVFSSVAFLIYFFPALVIIYHIVPVKFKNLVMIIASMVFYAWGEIRFIPMILLLSVVDYTCGRMMEKFRQNQRLRLLFMLISVVLNISVLAFFKYANFVTDNVNLLFGLSISLPYIILPIGISFNSFQNISYAIDVYRGTTTCEKSYYNYLCFTTLFPQIVSGPIVRYVTVQNDLDKHLITRDSFSIGMRRFLLGLGKKVLIANNVGYIWDLISTGHAGTPTVLLYWVGVIAYAFQIYFDFSGYSDMAIGIAKILGFTFDENFNLPYISRSITEFWRRWHMTLGSWFRDYVYIPLGGNRRGALAQVRNILIVWALTGLWHGAAWNFVFWGLYFAALLVLEKFVLFRFWKKVPAFVQHVYTLLLVLISWVIFYFDDISAMSLYLKGMFGMTGAALADRGSVFILLQYLVVFVVAAYCCTEHARGLVQRFERTKSKVAWGAVCAGYMVVFLVSIAYLVNSSYNPFLYFRF